MRRLYIKLVLWLNGYCTKHGVRHRLFVGNGCYLCTCEMVARECAEMNARDTYLDKLLEEFNR